MYEQEKFDAVSLHDPHAYGVDIGQIVTSWRHPLGSHKSGTTRFLPTSYIKCFAAEYMDL